MEPVASIERTLGRLEGKVDALLRNQAQQDHRILQVKDRVRELEAFKVKMGTTAAIVAGLVSALIGLSARFLP